MLTMTNPTPMHPARSVAERRERAVRKMSQNPIYRNRYANMRAIIESHGHAEVARWVEVSPQTLSQVAGVTFVDVVSDGRARDWEAKLGLEAGYLDADHGATLGKPLPVSPTQESLRRKATGHVPSISRIDPLRIAGIASGGPLTPGEDSAISLIQNGDSAKREELALLLVVAALHPAKVEIAKLRSLVTHLVKQSDRAGKLPDPADLTGLLDLLK